MSEPKYMSVKEFQEAGYLHEINRRVLHPLGIALSVAIDDHNGQVEFGPIHDLRDDPSGIIFDTLDGGKINNIENEISKRMDTRLEALGTWVQTS